MFGVTRDLSQGLEPYTINVSRVQLVENNISLGPTASSAVLVFRDRNVPCVPAALPGIHSNSQPCEAEGGCQMLCELSALTCHERHTPRSDVDLLVVCHQPSTAQIRLGARPDTDRKSPRPALGHRLIPFFWLADKHLPDGLQSHANAVGPIDESTLRRK